MVAPEIAAALIASAVLAETGATPAPQDDWLWTAERLSSSARVSYIVDATENAQESSERLVVRHRASAYAIAILIIISALSIGRELEPVWRSSGGHPFLIAWPAIILAASIGGLGPGLVATGLTSVGIVLWMDSNSPFRAQGLGGITAVAIFVTSGVAISMLTERLHRARSRESQLRRSREAILAIVAHDLRSPLNSVMFTTAIIRKKPEHLTRGLQSIERSVRRMEHLLRDLVDAAVLDHNGHLSIALAEEDVSAIIAEAIVAATAQAVTRAVSIESELGHGARNIRCDRERVLQVLGNLLGNAIKFTAEGSRVIVRTAALDNFVRIEVTDAGPGIKPEHQARVFQRHWTSAAKGTGAGLGLYIAYGIARAHGGQLWLHSEPGQGATFFLTIPTVSSAGAELCPSAEHFHLS